MSVRRDLLLRFLLLYGMLYCSFGLSSPFLPGIPRGPRHRARMARVCAWLGRRWSCFLRPSRAGSRMCSARFESSLALFAISAAVASLLYLPAHSFWLLALVNLTQAAMLAPLADALALSWSRSTMRASPGAFEYGWVRGTGSAAFIAGVLGQRFRGSNQYQAASASL